MIHKIIEILIYPFVYVYAAFQLSRTKAFYISGTGISKLTNRRMWFKTVLTTHGNIFPVRDIEDKMKEELEFSTCVVVYFMQIPKSMVPYVTQPMGKIPLTVTKTEVYEDN
jgi:hypothetical protein